MSTYDLKGKFAILEPRPSPSDVGTVISPVTSVLILILTAVDGAVNDQEKTKKNIVFLKRESWCILFPFSESSKKGFTN